MRLWDLSAGPASAGEHQLVGHKDRVVRARFSSDARWLVTTDFSSTRLWDLSTYRCRSTIPKKHGDFAYGTTWKFPADGKWLIVSKCSEIFLIDLQESADTLRPVALTGHHYERIGFAVSGDNHWLVTVDFPFNAPRGRAPAPSCRIWDLSAANPAESGVELPGIKEGLNRIRKGVNQINISWDSQWLLTGSENGIWLWPLGIPQLLKVTATTVGRELTPAEIEHYEITSPPT